MNEISPRLFLGSIHSAHDRDTLAASGVTHVLSVVECDIGHRQRVRREASEEEPFTRLIISMSDATSSRLDRHFDACSTFICEGLAKGSVLVHCKAGQSRSATLVIAHLMREEKWTLSKALQFVQQRRPSVQPNRGFMEQLRAFEVRLDLKEDDASTTVSDNCDEDCQDGEPVENDEASRDGSGVTAACDSEVATSDVKVEVADDSFGVNETRLRCERLRSRLGRLRTPAGLMGIAAPLRKRRYQ